MGAIGGLASGLIVDWWGSKDEKTEPDKQDIPDDRLAKETKNRKKRSQYSSLKQRSQKRRQQHEKAGKWWQQTGRRS